MADLLFGGFALMPGPVRKEKQLRIPDDFSKTHFTYELELVFTKCLLRVKSFQFIVNLRIRISFSLSVCYV